MAGTEVDYDPFDKPKEETKSTTSTVGTFARSALESAAQVPGVMYGGGVGAEVGAIGGPIGAVIGGIAGGLIAGVAQSYGINSLEEVVDKTFGTNIVPTKQQQAKEHPYAELAGGVVGFAAGPGAAVGIPQKVGQAVTGAAVMTGIGSAQRAISGGEAFDPTSMVVDAVSGAFIKASKLGERFSSSGGKIVSTAFKKDGVTVASGPKHPEDAKTELKQDLNAKEGFLDDKGQFYDRLEAVKKAKETGQISQDQELEKPKEGLHSGDLNSSDPHDPNFQTPERIQESIPKEVDGIPITHDLDKTRLDGSRVGATTKRDSEGKPTEIAVNVPHLVEQFSEKPWMHPKVEGVNPLPENSFSTPKEWVDFVIQHEVEHTKTPRPEHMSPAEYENQINQDALTSIKNRPVELQGEPKAAIAAEAKKLDASNISNPEEFQNHAQHIYETQGKEAAGKFFDDYKAWQEKMVIDVPKTNKELPDALHKTETYQTADVSEQVTQMKQNEKAGFTPEMRERVSRAEDGESKIKLTLEEQAKVDSIIKALDEENKILYEKAKAQGQDVGRERTTAPRVRIFKDANHPWSQMIKDFFDNKLGFGDKVAEEASANMDRSVFELDGGGRVIELQRGKHETTIYEWKKKKKIELGKDSNPNLGVGDIIKISVEVSQPSGAMPIYKTIESKIVDGSMHNIEYHSPYSYLRDAEAVRRMANIALKKQVRDFEFIENLKKSDLFKEVGRGPEVPHSEIPEGWKTPASIDKIPQLRGWAFDLKTAAMIEDFAKVWDNTLWMKLSNQIVKNMMLNPLPHMFNEVMHLWNARGLSAWVPGTGGITRLAESCRLAFIDVMKQTPFYREVMREGGSALGAAPRNNNYFRDIQDFQANALRKNAGVEKSFASLAKKLGTTVGDLYNGMSKASTKAMWVTRDIMYVQYIREIQQLESKRTGKPFSVKDAVAKAGKHMPNYRMSSEVLGSRMISRTLQNPNISMFSRYHYGMVKSMVNTVAELKPSNLKTPEGKAHFRDGIDSLLAIGVSLSILYPLMDKIAEEIFGKGAEQRRAGPYHLLKAVGDVASGKKDMSALVWPVFTFNPMLLSLGQLAFNKEIFSGKPIYHPGDPAGKVAKDVGMYAAKQIPQASTGVRGMDETGGDLAKQYLAKQIDIKTTSPKAQARADRAVKFGEAQKKRRLKEWLSQ